MMAVEVRHALTGLEENADYRQAESRARAALHHNPRDVWAVHALAHVIEANRRPAAGTNRAVADRAGLALLEGFSAFAAGRPGRAIDLMIDIRARASAVGGSHAQRDIIDLTLIAAAARAGQHSLAQALVAERVARKPSAAAAAHQLLAENARTATAGLAS
jgi:hypothetical protein